jgi:hypothetical protein
LCQSFHFLLNASGFCELFWWRFAVFGRIRLFVDQGAILVDFSDSRRERY